MTRTKGGGASFSATFRLVCDAVMRECAALMSVLLMSFRSTGSVSEPGLFMLALGEVFNLAGEREGMQDFSIGLSILQVAASVSSRFTY